MPEIVAADDEYNLLEIVQTLLPTTIALDSDFDTSKDHLLATTEINT